MVRLVAAIFLFLITCLMYYFLITSFVWSKQGLEKYGIQAKSVWWSASFKKNEAILGTEHTHLFL